MEALLAQELRRRATTALAQSEHYALPIRREQAISLEGRKVERMAKFKANMIWFLVGALLGATGMYLYARHSISLLFSK